VNAGSFDRLAQVLGATASRRRLLAASFAVAAASAVWTRAAAQTLPQTTQAPSAGSGQAADIIALVQDIMAKNDLRAVIVRVTIDGNEVVTQALGESMTGVPATTDMHFRNGAVAIAYVATALLRLVDQGQVGLDDALANWLPNLPESGSVTLRMLANMTAGYPDYVPYAQFQKAAYENPFRQWTPDELIALSTAQPRLFAPGTNWDYSHTNVVILGRALEQISGMPLAMLLREQIFTPLGLSDTDDSGTPAIPEPVLHAFSSERRELLGIDPATRFYEESTYWSPSWTLAQGAIETTNIYDMAATAEAVGTGALLSTESHQAQVVPNLLGFGSLLAGCRGCHTLDRTLSYGLGVVLSGSWILQNPLFFGYSGVAAYLPSQKIAIAAANTYGEGSFDAQGNYQNGSQKIFAAIGAYLAPDDPPPTSQ
jgi:CubicO group peptidase (beta-lactamase class C family)